MSQVCEVCRNNTADSGRACESCFNGVHNDLDEIGRRFRSLNASPGASGDNAGRRAPGFESSPPCNLAVIDLTDHRDSTSVPAVLGTWCARIVSEREVSAPADVDEGVAFLQRHLSWSAERGWWMSLVRDVRRLKGRLRPATGTPNGVSIGRCPNTLTEPDGVTTRECGAKLKAPVYGDQVICPNQSCQRVWNRRQWLNLGRVLVSEGTT